MSDGEWHQNRGIRSELETQEAAERRGAGWWFLSSGQAEDQIPGGQFQGGGVGQRGGRFGGGLRIDAFELWFWASFLRVTWTTMRLNSVQFSLVTQSCPTLWDPMDCSMPGLPVHHQLPELTQIHVHWVGDAIQPSHPLLSPSPAFNLSQHQSLFQWVSSSHQVAKVLEFQLQHQSFQWIFRTNFLLNGLVGYTCSPKDSQESSPTPQFKSINSSANGITSFFFMTE